MARLSLLNALALTAIFAATGCDKKEPHDHHGKEGSKQPGAMPTTYKDAIAEIRHHSDEIAGLITSNKLADVHHEAEEIKKIAEHLPELAQKAGMGGEMMKEINLKSKDLAAMFEDIDLAADSGKADETKKLHEKMKALISDLGKHAH